MTSTPYPSPVQRIFKEAFNLGNLTVVDEVLTPDHITHQPFSGVPNGPQDLKWLIILFRTAFPDLHCAVEDEIREGDMVAVRWTLCGTHNGTFLGNPPTGKKIKMQGMIFSRLADGLIVKYWMLIDQFCVLQQLGVIPQ